MKTSTTTTAATAAIVATAREIMLSDDGQASYEEIAEMAIRRHKAPLSAISEIASMLRQTEQREAARTAGIVVKPTQSRYDVLKAEWEAASAAAPRREVEVEDEDGGTSIVVRVDREWKYKGCTNLGQLLAADSQWVEEKAAEAAECLEAAKRFLANTASLSPTDRRQAFYNLPDGVRNVISGLLTRAQRREMM